MFNQEDRHRLDAIERGLLADDPELADRLRWPDAHERWLPVVSRALVALGTLGVLVGLVQFRPVTIGFWLIVVIAATLWDGRVPRNGHHQSR